MSKILSGETRYSLSDFRRREMEYYEAQPVKLSCAFCKWSFEGPAVKGRAAAVKHREKKHPETFKIRRPRRRGTRTLTTYRYTSMDKESIQEIETERKKRAFLNGVEIDG